MTMRNLLSVLFACFFATTNLLAQDILYISDPRFNTSMRTQGIITEPFIEVTPMGTHAQIDFTFKINADASSYKTTDSLESVLKFDLPQNSFLHDSWLWLDNTTIIRAAIIEKNRAIQIYEGIVKRRRDPSLLYKTGANSYQLSVFPLTLNYPRKVKITYSVPFNWQNNKVNISIPVDIVNASNVLPELVMKVNYNSTYTQPAFSEIPFQSYIVNSSGNSHTLSIPAIAYGVNTSINLSYNINTGNTPIVSTYPMNGSEGYYQLIVPPAAIAGHTPKNTVYIVDNSAPGSSIFSVPQVKSYLKSSLLNDYNPLDSFNVFYYNGSTVVQEFAGWRPVDSANISSVIAHIPSTGGPNPQYETLLKNALAFCKTKSGAHAQVVILSNNSNYTNNQASVDALYNNIKSYIGALTNKIHVLNYSAYSTYSSAGYIKGNEPLYSKLCVESGGNHYKYNSAYYYYVANKYYYLYDLNAANSLREISWASGQQINTYNISLAPNTGFAHSKYDVHNMNKLVQNRPYVETGKYYGSVLPGTKVSVQAVTATGMINQTYTMGSINGGNTSFVTCWVNRHIENLISQNNNAFVQEIIDSSLHNRVLCNYTAFLALENGDTINSNINDNPNAPITTNTDNVIKAEPASLNCYPNPFYDNITIELPNGTLFVEIYDVTGRKIFTRKVANNAKTMVWDGRDNNSNAITAGLYIVVVRTETGTVTAKVSKQ